MRRFLSFVAPCVLSFVLAGCAGSTSSPPAQVSITILPTSASVAVGQTQQFTASINGQPSSAVTWQVNAITGGNATAGTISTFGAYHAPNSVPTTSTSGGGSVAAPVTVTAVSQANPSSSGSATVTVFAPNQNAELIPVKLGTTGGNANDSSTSGRTITCTRVICVAACRDRKSTR